MGDTTSRILQLLSLLQTHREWSGGELADRLEVSERTIRRDIDRLRELGYPVDATPGVAGGYRLQAGASLPPLLLDDDEAVAITLGLRNAAAGTVAGIEESSVRALAKLEQVLPKRLRRRVAALQNFTVPLVWPGSGPTVDSETLILIAQACRDFERLRFDYRSREGAETQRLVEPHRLVSAGRRWYLVAWDNNRNDWRTFRADRLSNAKIDNFRFNPRELPAEDAAAFVAQALAATPVKYQAVVKIYAPAAQVIEKMRASEGDVDVIDDNTSLLRTSGDSLDWMTFILGMVGADFEIQQPPELIEYVAGLSHRLQKAAAGPK